MIEKTISEIEAKVREAASVGGDRKQELLDLLEKLKTEVTTLAKTNEEQADSIAGFTRLSTHEATRKEQNPELLQHSVAGLRSSVEGFEQSHPRLVQIVNSISNTARLPLHSHRRLRRGRCDCVAGSDDLADGARRVDAGGGRSG